MPLLEIVGEPDLRSADEAAEYLKALRDVLVYLGVNDGNLEEGSLPLRRQRVGHAARAPASSAPAPSSRTSTPSASCSRPSTTRSRRQVELIESGGKVVQETRLYDPQRGETRSMRSKEEAHDYRYFPEPDLPPLRRRARR